MMEEAILSTATLRLAGCLVRAGNRCTTVMHLR
jgi:hypothetical protein